MGYVCSLPIILSWSRGCGRHKCDSGLSMVLGEQEQANPPWYVRCCNVVHNSKSAKSEKLLHAIPIKKVFGLSALFLLLCSCRAVLQFPGCPPSNYTFSCYAVFSEQWQLVLPISAIWFSMLLVTPQCW